MKAKFIKHILEFRRYKDPRTNLGLNKEKEITDFLLSIGKKPSLRRTSVLVYAARERRYDLVNYLLSIGINPNSKNNQGFSGLTYSIRNDDEKMLNIFLSKKISQSILIKALKTAFYEENPYFVKKVIAAGVDLKSFDPINDAIRFTHDEDIAMKIIKILLKAGADPNTLDRWRETPIMNAVRFDYLKLAKFLLPLTDNLWQKGYDGKDILDIANKELKKEEEQLFFYDEEDRDNLKKFIKILEGMKNES